MTWSVLRIVAGLGAGAQVERGLKRLHFEFYNPKIEETWVVNRRQVTRSVQLFPGYLFVNIFAQWKAITALAGALDFILWSGHPAPLRDDIVNQLRSAEVDGYVALPPPLEPYPRGTKIAFLPGPSMFTGRTALFDGMRGSERAAVLLTMLGKTVRHIVPLDEIARAV